MDDPNQLRGLEMQQIIRANMLKAAVAQQFEVIPCSDASIDSLIRETLQDRLSLFRLRNELVEPVVCGIVEGSLFSSLVPFLKLDGFDDIIYVYNSKNIPLETVPSLEGLDETSDTMISKLVRYSFPWSYLCGGQRGMTKLRTYLRETFTGNSRGNSGSILHLSSSSSNILPTSSVELDTISNSHVDLDYESSLRRESNSSSWSMSSASRIISPKNPTSFSTKKCLLLKQWREHYESISRIGTNESLSNRTDPVMHSKQVGTLQHVVDLKCFGVAVYFQKLMAWRSVALHRQRHQQVKRGQRKQSSAQFELDSFLEEEDDFSEVDFDTLPPMTNYFAPLLFHEECDSGYIGEEDKCNLKVVMDTENRRYELIVKGTNVEALHRRCKRLTQMVAEALANRQTHLLPNWKTEQYMCLNSSGVIAAHELRSKAIVIFRNAGEKSSSRTVAEIVALQSRCHNKLWGYIEKLVPLSMSWNIPQSSVTAFTDTDWENFRYKYAVNVGKCTLIELTHGSAGEGASSEAQGDDGKKLPASMQLSCKYLHFEKVWGFHGLLDEALKFLLSGFSERNSPEIPDGVMQTFSKVSIRALNAEESISPSKAPSVGVATLSSLVESVAKNKPVTLKGNRNSKGSYLFQDRGISSVTFHHFVVRFRICFIVSFVLMNTINISDCPFLRRSRHLLHIL